MAPPPPCFASSLAVSPATNTFTAAAASPALRPLSDRPVLSSARSRRARLYGAPASAAPASARVAPRAELAQNEAAKESEERMQKTIDSVRSNFNTVRTGRASPTLLDRVSVSYYGAETPLNQLATVSVSGTSTLVVEPFDKSSVADVERALMESDLGLTPNSDGGMIRLTVPQLTSERREQLVKQLKSMAEDGRVAVRNIRRDAVDKLKKLEKKKDLGKDESKTMQDDVQKLTDKFVKQIDKLFKDKEADIKKL